MGGSKKKSQATLIKKALKDADGPQAVKLKAIKEEWRAVQADFDYKCEAKKKVEQEMPVVDIEINRLKNILVYRRKRVLQISKFKRMLPRSNLNKKRVV